LIEIRLLGSYKKELGCSSLNFEKHAASGYDSDFKSGHSLIVVNGIDSSLLDVNKSLVKDGDIVTVIPIIHGG
jgi:molybdopterin converting factor small subunit